MDIYERILDEHKNHRDLAAKLEATEGDSEKRRKLWDRFKPEAAAHANAEEQTFYAALLNSPDVQEQARHSITEHQKIDNLLEELEETPMDSGAWLVKFRKLEHKLEHHMEEEENDVFSLARELLSDDEAERLGAEFAKRKQAELEAAGATARVA